MKVTLLISGLSSTNAEIRQNITAIWKHSGQYGAKAEFYTKRHAKEVLQAANQVLQGSQLNKSGTALRYGSSRAEII
jgi:hypothetical protein